MNRGVSMVRSETRDKMKELDIKIAKGTRLLRDVEEVSTAIRVQSFSEGASQDEARRWVSCVR